MVGTGEYPAKTKDAIARLAQVIGSVTTGLAASRGLSALQLGILTYLAAAGEPKTLGEVANRLRLSAPTVSDSVTSLANRGLLSKMPGRDDTRTVQIEITEAGRALCQDSGLRTERLGQLLESWDVGRQSTVFQAVLELIEALQKPSSPRSDRCCVGCRHLAINCDVVPDAPPHYCRALNLRMQTLELRLDCPEFAASE